MSTEPYIATPLASQLFADPVYQRDVDAKRVKTMAAAFDERLLGVVDVSKRDGTGRFAILDGQHRHAVLVAVRGEDAPIVCNVYEGLSIDDEARLFHEINVRRKTLNFWDRWKARRAAGEPIVLEIEEVLAAHGLQVDPAPRDGNVAANVALERIVGELGDRWLLDAVLQVLLAAFGRSRDAFQGPIMHGLALVLANYRPDELDRDRLVQQLSKLPVRQLRARAAGLREMHKGTEPRLVGAVVVDQYNKAAPAAGYRRAESFFLKVPVSAGVSRSRWAGRPVTGTTPSAPEPDATPPTVPASWSNTLDNPPLLAAERFCAGTGDLLLHSRRTESPRRRRPVPCVRRVRRVPAGGGVNPLCVICSSPCVPLADYDLPVCSGCDRAMELVLAHPEAPDPEPLGAAA